MEKKHRNQCTHGKSRHGRTNSLSLVIDGKEETMIPETSEHKNGRDRCDGGKLLKFVFNCFDFHNEMKGGIIS